MEPLHPLPRDPIRTPERVQAGEEQALVHVDIAEPRHEPLVEQQGLQGPAPRLEVRREALHREVRAEGLGPQGLQGRGPLGGEAEAPELSHVQEAEPRPPVPGPVEVELHPLVGLGRLLPGVHHQPARHAEVAEDRPRGLPPPLEVHDDPLGPPANRGDGRPAHRPGELVR